MRIPRPAHGEILPEGEHDFQIIDAHEKPGETEIMILRLRVGVNGSSVEITDCVLSSQLRKLRTLATAVDLLELYTGGQLLPIHLIGRRGRLVLGVEKSSNRKLPDINVVVSYGAEKR